MRALVGWGWGWKRGEADIQGVSKKKQQRTFDHILLVGNTELADVDVCECVCVSYLGAPFLSELPKWKKWVEEGERRKRVGTKEIDIRSISSSS